MGETGYFEKEYISSRHEYVEEVREIIEKGPPAPEQDWEVIWVLSGPEQKFDDPPREGKYNQTKHRFETAVNIAKEVTALRLQKMKEEVTLEDIAAHGPTLYFNGRDDQNQAFRELIAGQGVEKEFQFPDAKVMVSSDLNIQSTSHQFELFPKDFVPEDAKLVVVTDLYHLPRTRRYFDKFPLVEKDKRVLYPALPASIPPRAALEEAKKIYPYIQQGFL